MLSLGMESWMNLRLVNFLYSPLFWGRKERVMVQKRCMALCAVATTIAVLLVVFYPREVASTDVPPPADSAVVSADFGPSLQSAIDALEWDRYHQSVLAPQGTQYGMIIDGRGYTHTVFLPRVPLTAEQQKQMREGEQEAKETLRDLQRGIPLASGEVNSFGEVARGGYLYLAARVTSDGQVGAAIDLRKEALPADAAWQVMVWPKRHGVTGSLTYAMVSYGGRVETLTNTSAGYSGEGIVTRNCNCFVDAARQIALQRSLSGSCCAHGDDRWQPVTN